jgi:hypothetical protein
VRPPDPVEQVGLEGERSMIVETTLVTAPALCWYADATALIMFGETNCGRRNVEDVVADGMVNVMCTITVCPVYVELTLLLTTGVAE